MTSRQRWASAAVVVAMIGTSALVWQSTTAAFTATTTTGVNTLTSGRVVLSDSTSGSALFSASGLVPGPTPPGTDTKCVDVTYSGDVTAGVKFYATYDTASGLAPYLDFQVDQIAAGASCAPGTASVAALYGSGTLAGLVTANHDWATGLGSWTATTTETRRYRVTYALQDTNAAQGKTAQVRLTWEARTP